MAAARPSLRIAFDSAEAFQREFDSNLSNGGAFVRTERALDLRAQVDVELCLNWCKKSIKLEAEVVHLVPREMAGVGATPGVAVQFLLPVQTLRERLGALVVTSKRSADTRKDAGMRKAQRKPVRVAAQIETGGAVLSGQTRNLSLTGVLVGVGGQGVPIGQTVSLMLEHPQTRERKAIAGRVVRHVQSEGDVSALAVEFTPGDADREGIERFVEDLQSIEHARRLGGISGPIAELGPESLIQMFATTATRGTLVLRCGQEEGIIAFEKGLLRVAQIGSTTGMKALVRMLSWRDGVFEFQSRIDDSLIAGAPFPLEAALLDAVRQMDEGTTVASDRFPLHARLVRTDGDLGAHGEPSKVEAALLDLAGAGFTVQRALEVIPEPDPEIFRGLRSLVDAGLVELVV